MARIATFMRINNLFHKQYLKEIHVANTSDEYVFFHQGYDDPFSGESDRFVDIARPENSSRFWEAASGFNQSPEEMCAEAQLRFVFEKALEAISNKGKDAASYNKVIRYYLDGHGEDLKKQDEITALSALLGTDRKKTREVKCRALKILNKEISRIIRLDDHRKGMKQKMELAKRFKKISDKSLRELYRRPDKASKPASKVRTLCDFTEAELVEIRQNHCFPDSPYYQPIKPKTAQKPLRIVSEVFQQDNGFEIFEEAA
jgi:hypothetical protein